MIPVKNKKNPDFFRWGMLIFIEGLTGDCFVKIKIGSS
jgi:hypothetical protein